MLILGFDIGEVRTGVAKSDETGLIASTLTTIKYDHEDYQTCLDRMLDLLEEYQPDEVVLGLPRHMNGDIGKKGELTLQFQEELQKCTNIPIKTWDERLTTVQSQKMLIGADVRRNKRKQVVDKIAATFILQSYLDAQRNKG